MKPSRGEILRQYGITAGTLGSTAGQTVMVAVLPVLLAKYARSAVWIGFAVGGEGVFALLVPYWIGYLSDHLHPRLAARFGRRVRFKLRGKRKVKGGTGKSIHRSSYLTLWILDADERRFTQIFGTDS